MLTRARHGGTLWPRRASAVLAEAGAGVTARAQMSTAAMQVVEGPVAKELDATGIWKRAGGRKKANAMQANEPRRVNIVSQELCDDIIKYIGPSLERHRGCDLIDLNPGTGLWSRSLHEFLQPRKHVMMDHDAALYAPFLKELLAKDSVHMIPKAGVLWRDLLEMTHSQLGHQRKLAPGETPSRNDTLLVTANLSTSPKKPFLGFDSLSTMVLYQLVSSIRTSSLFQRYGLVRMLVWINDEDKHRMLPRSLQRRNRSSFVGELACEWIHQVAGVEADVEDRLQLRDAWLNIESGYNTVLRMMAAGQTMPPHRATRTYTEAMAPEARDLLGTPLAGLRMPFISRPFQRELEHMEHELAEHTNQAAAADNINNNESGPLASETALGSRRLQYLRGRSKQDHRLAEVSLDLLRERTAIFDLYRQSLSPSSSPSSRSSAAADFAAADAAWNAKIDNMSKNARNEFLIMRDSLHLFRQSPPPMLWDRRAYEPLTLRPTEFFPNAPTVLLDIQPQPMHPLLLRHGPGSGDSGPLSDVMLRAWFSQPSMPVRRAMDAISGGFGDLLDRCPSLVHPDRGGSPMTARGALSARSINAQQWGEIVEAWMDWPFRPTYARMLGLIDDEGEFEEDDSAKQHQLASTW